MHRPCSVSTSRRALLLPIALATLALGTWAAIRTGTTWAQGTPAPSPAATPGARSLLEVAAEAGNFKTLLSIVQAAGWTEKLEREGPFTLFAPTDEAFTKLPAGTLENLLKPENKERLVQLLSYHVVPGRQTAAELARNPEVKTLLGDEVDIDVDADGKAAQVDEANLTIRDLPAANGVLHVIDRVLQP